MSFWDDSRDSPEKKKKHDSSEGEQWGRYNLPWLIITIVESPLKLLAENPP